MSLSRKKQLLVAITIAILGSVSTNAYGDELKPEEEAVERVSIGRVMRLQTEWGWGGGGSPRTANDHVTQLLSPELSRAVSYVDPGRQAKWKEAAERLGLAAGRYLTGNGFSLNIPDYARNHGLSADAVAARYHTLALQSTIDSVVTAYREVKRTLDATGADPGAVHLANTFFALGGGFLRPDVVDHATLLASVDYVVTRLRGTEGRNMVQDWAIPPAPQIWADQIERAVNRNPDINVRVRGDSLLEDSQSPAH